MEDRFDNYERYIMDMRALLFAFDQGYPDAYEVIHDDCLVGEEEETITSDANAQTPE